jgi:hypothetical protein
MYHSQKYSINSPENLTINDKVKNNQKEIQHSGNIGKKLKAKNDKACGKAGMRNNEEKEGQRGMQGKKREECGNGKHAEDDVCKLVKEGRR